MPKLTVFLFTLCLLLIYTRPAYAYLDPGSGSMILQLLLAGMAGAAVILKLFWRKLLTLFGIGKKKGDME